MLGGRGGNFGVLTQVGYSMVPLPSVCAWAISWDATDAATVLAPMQNEYMVSGCPDQLCYMMNVGFYQGQAVYMVQGMYAGDRNDGLEIKKKYDPTNFFRYQQSISECRRPL